MLYLLCLLEGHACAVAAGFERHVAGSLRHSSRRLGWVAGFYGKCLNGWG